RLRVVVAPAPHRERPLLALARLGLPLGLDPGARDVHGAAPQPPSIRSTAFDSAKGRTPPTCTAWVQALKPHRTRSLGMGSEKAATGPAAASRNSLPEPPRSAHKRC